MLCSGLNPVHRIQSARNAVNIVFSENVHRVRRKKYNAKSEKKRHEFHELKQNDLKSNYKKIERISAISVNKSKITQHPSPFGHPLKRGTKIQNNNL